jgi:predicted Fe-S protein YdhL (DUF1289 family)
MTVAFPGADPIFVPSANRRRAVIESPCNRICTLDPASGLCLGCGRSLDEIMRWTQMSDAERRSLIAELDRRLHKPRPAAV